MSNVISNEFVQYIQVRHFPCPSISGIAIWSVIFQVRHFQALRFGPLFSCPAFSGLAVSALPQTGTTVRVSATLSGKLFQV